MRHGVVKFEKFSITMVPVSRVVKGGPNEEVAVKVE
jgi:hypothetical protein